MTSLQQHKDEEAKTSDEQTVAHSHFDGTKPRVRGLGDNILHCSEQTLCVKDIASSKAFYENVLKLKLSTDTKYKQNDETVTFFCEKGFHVTLILGEPVSFAGVNLIVSHMAMDLPDGYDVKKAFDHLRLRKVSELLRVELLS